MAREYPCHDYPKENWCDRNGVQGGFMGHTCKATHRATLESNKRKAAEAIRIAEEDLRDAQVRYGHATDALSSFEFRFGSRRGN